MKRISKFLLGMICCFAALVFVPTLAHAQSPSSTPKPEFHRAKIISVISETKTQGDNGQPLYTQVLKLQRQDTNETFTVTAGSDAQPLSETQRYTTGTEVIVSKQQITSTDTEYVITDTYRLPTLGWLLLGFCVLVVVIARFQGLFSIVGMTLSLSVLLFFVVPQIIAGQNPVLISLFGSGVVAILTIYLCHGFKLQTHISLLSMLLCLIVVGLLSFFSVQLAHLAGLGNEDAMYLQFGTTAKINLRGLLLGGMMLGAIGLLADIIVSQVSLTFQLFDTKPNMTFQELYARSLAVGKDHVASLVNTLILAYAGSSMPLFLLFTLNDAQPAWVTLNMEVIAEEVVRTLTGSIGLVIAVPLSTLIACYFAMQVRSDKRNSND